MLHALYFKDGGGLHGFVGLCDSTQPELPSFNLDTMANQFYARFLDSQRAVFRRQTKLILDLDTQHWRKLSKNSLLLFVVQHLYQQEFKSNHRANVKGILFQEASLFCQSDVLMSKEPCR